jgi:DNA modification methylase
VWRISRVCGTFRERLPEFPTQLPLALLRRIVRTASDPGDLVVDPFSGWATTGVGGVLVSLNGREAQPFLQGPDMVR